MPPPPAIPTLDPRKRDFALRQLQNPTCSMEDVAESLGLTLEQLTLYLASDEGLQLIAEAELSLAVRTRIAAAAHLHHAIDALGMMLSEYADGTRNIALDDRKHSTHVLHEAQRGNARRAAHLLFRLAHFTPKPIRAYGPSPHGGGVAASATEGATRPSFSSSPLTFQSPQRPALQPAQEDSATPDASPSVSSLSRSPARHLPAAKIEVQHHRPKPAFAACKQQRRALDEISRSVHERCARNWDEQAAAARAPP